MEMSPQRSCAICHIMWLEDFRTDKETLIEWQPGNVLMKDTQGVVSSEEICYSCHDGYVCDSRYTVWKFNRHKMFIRPPKDITTPTSLTLSNKGEIYCGTCHSPHGAGSAPKDSSGGLTSFFRVPNVDSGLCEMCHGVEADYKLSNSHPVHTTVMNLPDKLFELGSIKAGNKNNVTCQTCHNVHGAKGDNITIINNNQSELCILCHEERVICGTRHDLRKTWPDAKNNKQQPISESGPCGTCHTPHRSAGYKLWARNLEPGNPASQSCLSCHDTEIGQKIKGLGEYSHPNNVEQISRLVVSDKLPLFSLNGEKSHGGKIQCFTCHNVHKWDPLSSANKGKPEVEGNASNSFLRISNSGTSHLCLECHDDKNQILKHDHNLQLTAPEEKNVQGFNADISGLCGACHIPHNATGNRLWAKPLSKDVDLHTQYCLGCHDKNGAAKKKLIGENDHPVNKVCKGFNIAPPDRVIKTLPLFNKDGSLESGEIIGCLTCHEPHKWKNSLLPPVQADSPGNTEGNATTSFLRESACPTLCTTCHENSKMLIGTDHDLSVTAPLAKDSQGRTVKESGQCGTCHAVHNSPKKLKLWSRPLGPIKENENMMNALCTSCHSKGGVAENKIPTVAYHPEALLTTNIIRFNTQGEPYTPLFDGKGKEVNIGDISCSSCHSFYMWNHRTLEQGTHKNIEGDAMNSFLRISIDTTVCIDCHGEEAIWRYKHFHSPEKRNKIKTEKSVPDIGSREK